MRTPVKSAAILALAISALTIGGCEKVESESARADKRVAQHIRKGEQSLNVGVADEKSVRAAEDALAQAVGEKTASSMTKARANSLLGQAQFEQAKLLIRQIDHNETEIAGVVWEIGRQASTIESASAVIEAMNKRNPAPTLEAVDKQKKKAEGGADEPLWAEKTSIPTLSAVAQYPLPRFRRFHSFLTMFHPNQGGAGSRSVRSTCSWVTLSTTEGNHLARTEPCLLSTDKYILSCPHWRILGSQVSSACSRTR